MKFIIIEGISTSGKSTIQQKLKNYFEDKGKSVLVVDEKKSINNLFEEKTRNLENSLKLLEKLILVNSNPNYTGIQYFDPITSKQTEIPMINTYRF